MGRKVDIKVYLDNGEKLFLDKVKWESIEPNIEKKNYDGSYTMNNGDLVVIIENYYAKGGEVIEPQEVIDAWKEHRKKGGSSYNLDHFGNPKFGQEMYRYYCRRDGCGPAALDITYFAKNKYGIELKSPFPNKTQGYFRADKVASNKKDFTPEMKIEFFEDGGNWDNAKERRVWIENSKYSEAWKYIPHYWLVDKKGNIYDPVGQEQFVDKKLAKDLDKSRYVEDEPEVDYSEGGKLRKENEKKEKNFPQNPDDISGKELKEHFDLNNDGKVTIEEYAEHVKYHCKNPETLDDELEQAEYERGFKYKKGGKTKEAKTWKEKYNKKYGFELNKSHSLSEIAKKTGVSKKGIQKIYNKGIGAYKTNPQSVRPNVKSKEQWAYARVYSSVMGGNAAKVDAKELKMAKGGWIVRIEDLNKGDILEGKLIKSIDRLPDYTGVWFTDGDYKRYAKGSTTKKDYKEGGEIEYIKYKDEEIMYEPHFKEYYVDDSMFETLSQAKEHIDKGSPMDAGTIDAYKKGLFSKGGKIEGLKSELKEINKVLENTESGGEDYAVLVEEKERLERLIRKSYEEGGEIDIYNSLGWWLLNSPEGKKVLKKSKNIPEFKKNIKKELPISAPGIGPIKKVDKDFDWEYLWKYTKIYNKGGKIDNFEYYTDWDSFWEFYIESVKKDIGDNKFKVSSSSRIAKSLSRIPDNFRINTLNPLIRKAGMVSKKVALKYDPKATTFYSTYDRNRKQFVIGYPTFTQYMCYWEPAMKAAFRHEMGHILRGDCLLTFDFSKVKRANACMDIRINSQLNREAMEQVYKCLYFNNKAVPLLVPEQQFPKIGMPFDEENPIVPDWWIIADYFNRANDRQKGTPKPPQPEGKDKYEVGDYVIINKETSEHNDKPGKVVDIDGDNYIIEEISQEEFEAVFEQMKAAGQMLEFAAANFILGDFKDDELLPLVPQDDPGGDYGDDDDEGGEPDGDEGGEDGEGGEGGEPKTPEEEIEEAEKILNDLINAGINGEDESEAVYDDEVSKDDKEENKDGKEEDDKDGKEEGKEEDDKGDIDDKGDGEGGDKEKPTQEQEDRLSDIEKKIREVNLNNKIKQSLDNYQKIKSKHKDKMTAKEISEIDKAIDNLEKII